MRYKNIKTPKLSIQDQVMIDNNVCPKCISSMQDLYNSDGKYIGNRCIKCKVNYSKPDHTKIRQEYYETPKDIAKSVSEQLQEIQDEDYDNTLIEEFS